MSNDHFKFCQNLVADKESAYGRKLNRAEIFALIFDSSVFAVPAILFAADKIMSESF